MDTSAHTRADQSNQAASTQPAPAMTPSLRPQPDASLPWHELFAQVGRELAEPLTAALERVTTLTTTGRLDRAGLLALRHEVSQARQVGLRSQQMARLASGFVQRTEEPVDLAELWREVLHDRARDLRSHGIVVASNLAPTEVHADASMVFGLMHAWIDWLMGTASGKVSVALSADTNSLAAQIECQFATRSQVHVDSDGTGHPLNNLSWFQLAQTAHLLEAALSRHEVGGQVTLSLRLPR